MHVPKNGTEPAGRRPADPRPSHYTLDWPKTTAPRHTARSGPPAGPDHSSPANLDPAHPPEVSRIGRRPTEPPSNAPPRFVVESAPANRYTGGCRQAGPGAGRSGRFTARPAFGGPGKKRFMFKPIRSAAAAAIGLLMLAAASEGAWYGTADELDEGHDWAKTSRFDPFLHLTAYKPDGTAVSSGTATLISPEWVLTASAAHFRLADSLGSVRLLSCYDPVNVPATHTRWALEIKTHHDQPQVIGDGVDLMLLRIDPITNIAPVSLFTGSPQVGMEFVGAGFGTPGSVETGMLAHDWRKRAGNNEVSAEAFGLGGYIRSIFDQGPNALPLEWNGTTGDSGGPWLNEADELFAVTSFRVDGFLTGGQPIYPYLPWIYSVTGLPEPGTLVLLLTGGALLFRRRRLS